MRKNNAMKAFDQYNPRDGVLRCPYGRAGTKKMLNDYACAAVNLYGAISRKDLVEIFNAQNTEQTTVEEIYALLLPLVFKNGNYCFYKDYIVNSAFSEDLVVVENLLMIQGNKPRYLPRKEDFLRYKDAALEDNEEWLIVLQFMLETSNYIQSPLDAFYEIRHYITYSDGISELDSILEIYDVEFDCENHFMEFINLVINAKNATRIWDNKGYSPNELDELINKKDEGFSTRFPVINKKQVGRNDPCPCGSGKKYKKCCAIINDAKTSHLSPEECHLFYQTWLGLISFVNERMGVLNISIEPVYPNPVTDVMIHKVREVLWKSPALIDKYLEIKSNSLPAEQIEILKLWSTRYKKGLFFVLEYQSEYTLMLEINEVGVNRLYGVKGISNAIEFTLQRNVPVSIETVLLPFKGMIIYDSFMASLSMTFGEGAKSELRDLHAQAMKFGVLTSL